MSYKRKTRDEFTLQGSYGFGFEDLTTEETKREIYARLREYRANEPTTPLRIIKRRIRIEQGSPTGEQISKHNRR